MTRSATTPCVFHRSFVAFGALAICMGAIPSAPATAQNQPENPLNAVFGIIVTDAAGLEHFLESNEVPNVEGQGYGWIVRVPPSNAPVKWTEKFTLPEPAEQWTVGSDGLAVTISADGRTATTEGEEAPTEGVIAHFWAVATGDPNGEYIMEISVGASSARVFRFNLYAPKP